jgi:hypothetical protein
MSRVHFINKIAPMPPLATIEGSGRRLQGGLPPGEIRNAFSNIAGVHSAKANKRTPTTSPTWFRMEREFRLGLRAYDFE